MKKYILTSLVALLTHNAYGAFDFENYTPTLGTNSAYTLSFTSVADDAAPNTITTYSVDYDNYSFTPLYYTYSATYGSPTNNRQNINSNGLGINNVFIGNGGASSGGAIYNDGYTINSVTGDFIGNNVSAGGGAIWVHNGTINSITGDFIENHAGGSSGAIMNYGSDIGNITGNFIGNYSKQAGAISNGNDSTIASVSGNFIGNHTTDTYGGSAIKNHGTINSITADFIGNYDGGAIYNEGTIDSLTGDFINNESKIGGAINNRNIYTIGSINGNFIGNTATNYAGAIYNRATIGSITADFIGNTATNYAGAICNENVIGSISGNFIGNYTTETNGGAIYTDESIRFLSETDSYIISDNYGGDNDIAIITGNDYDVSKDIFITFENNNSTHYTVNDEIRNDITCDSPYSITVTGDGTGYTQFNNDLYNVNTVNINNGTMIFGRTPDSYTRTADIGHFVGTNNPIMNLNNGTFDIANGYTEVITLNGITALGNDNFLKLDLDIENNDSDVINVNGDISGQINIIISGLQDLDLENQVVWFANATGDVLSDSFVLSSVENLGYDLDIVFDSADKRWGIKKEGANIPEQQPVLPTAVVQMADHMSRTVVHTVQKLTNSMQKRVGELRWSLQDSENNSDTDNQSDMNNAFWTRGIYKNFDTNHTSIGLSGMEFGYDRIVSSTENYKWYVGGLGYMSGGDSKFNNTNLDIAGYGFGAYVMLLEKTGWFGDFIFRQHFIDIEEMGIKSDYTASSFNIEAGKEFVFGNNTDELKWFIKPSLEGTYISISGTDIGSFKVKDSSVQTLSLSALAGPRWNFESGKKFQAYGKIGYSLDNSDDVDVVINDVNTKQTVATNTIELGIGFDFRDNATNIYMEASYITSTDYSETSGNFGVRYTF